MTIKVLAFAALADRMKVRELDLELSEGATVGDALVELERRYDAVAAMRGRLALAVEMTYVGPEHVLRDGDELALIPPVSGG